MRTFDEGVRTRVLAAITRIANAGPHAGAVQSRHGVIGHTDSRRPRRGA